MERKGKYSILVGDDSELDLMFAEEVLKAHNKNFQVLLAHDGQKIEIEKRNTGTNLS